MNKKTEKSDDLKKAFEARQAKEIAKAEPESNLDAVKKLFEDRFTKKKLEEWKSQYGGRDLLYLKYNDNLAVLRPVTSEDLGEYMMAIGENGMSKAVAFILDLLWIDGDAALVTDDDSFNAVFLQINKILEGKKAEFFRF